MYVFIFLNLLNFKNVYFHSLEYNNLYTLKSVPVIWLVFMDIALNLFYMLTFFMNWYFPSAVFCDDV